jgi:hypothetical protein
MTNRAKSLRAAPPDETDLPPPPDPAATVAQGLVSLKWFCWYGNLVRALATIIDLQADAEVAQPSLEQARFLKALREFDSYLRANAGRLPNYGERRRAGEAISTAFVESTVNQVISKRMVKKTADALDTPRRPPATSGPHPSPQRPTRRRLPPLVPPLQPLDLGSGHTR